MFSWNSFRLYTVIGRDFARRCGAPGRTSIRISESLGVYRSSTKVRQFGIRARDNDDHNRNVDDNVQRIDAHCCCALFMRSVQNNQLSYTTCSEQRGQREHDVETGRLEFR